MIASESRQPTGIRLRDKSSPQRWLSALVAVLLGRAMFGEPSATRGPRAGPDRHRTRAPAGLRRSRAAALVHAYLFVLQKLADPFHQGLGIEKVGQDHGIAQDVALEEAFVELLPAAERATGHIPRQMK